MQKCQVQKDCRAKSVNKTKLQTAINKEQDCRSSPAELLTIVILITAYSSELEGYDHFAVERLSLFTIIGFALQVKVRNASYHVLSYRIVSA